MIYVDRLREARWRYGKACHLFTNGNIDELHVFAVRLGLGRNHFQDHAKLKHYDLTENKRRLAVSLGAREIRRHVLAGAGR